MNSNFSNHQNFKRQVIHIPANTLYTVNLSGFPANFYNLNHMTMGELYCSVNSLPKKDLYDFRVSGASVGRYTQPLWTEELYILNDNDHDVYCILMSWAGEFDPSFMGLSEITVKTEGETQTVITGFAEGLPEGDNKIGTVALDSVSQQLLNDTKEYVHVLQSAHSSGEGIKVKTVESNDNKYIGVHQTLSESITITAPDGYYISKFISPYGDIDDLYISLQVGDNGYDYTIEEWNNNADKFKPKSIDMWGDGSDIYAEGYFICAKASDYTDYLNILNDFLPSENFVRYKSQWCNVNENVVINMPDNYYCGKITLGEGQTGCVYIRSKEIFASESDDYDNDVSIEEWNAGLCDKYTFKEIVIRITGGGRGQLKVEAVEKCKASTELLYKIFTKGV